MPSPIRIDIRGVLGSGKSTLMHALSERLSLPARPEPLAEYEYLACAYEEPEKYRETAQVDIFQRLLTYQRQTGILDMTVEDCLFVFTKYYLGEDSKVYKYLETLYTAEVGSNRLVRPALTIFLEPDPEVVHRRIRLRRRRMESSVTLKQVKGLTALLRADRETNYRSGDYVLVQDADVSRELYTRIEDLVYARLN